MGKIEVLELRSLARLLGLSDERVRQVVREEVVEEKMVTPQFDVYIGSRAVRVVSWEAAREHWIGKKTLNPVQEQYLDDQLRTGTIVTALSFPIGEEEPKETEIRILNAGVFRARRSSGAVL